MTDEELKALVAENSRAIRVMQEESEQRRQESEQRRQESERRWAESDRKWAESERQQQELREESERKWQEGREELLASRREMDRAITSFNRELGRLGNALGDFTESFMERSLRRVLLERFGMKTVISPQNVWIDGDEHEIDMVGYGDEVYLVEIKSKLREEGIQQLLGHLRLFPRAFPEHRGKKLFGVLAAVKIPKDLRTRALKEGIYLATIKDDICEITTPDDFEPRTFGLRSLNP